MISHPLKQRTLISTVCLLLCLSSFCKASITIVDTGKKLPSKQDRQLVGASHLASGLSYMAHLQYVHSNLVLCDVPGTIWNITKPSDGVPVALIARKGTCTNTEKLRVAATKIYPPDTVRYVIIDGDESIRNSDAAVMLAAEQFSEEETERTTLTEKYDRLQLSSLSGLENNQNEDDSQTLQSKSPDDDEDESDMSATDDVSYDDEPYPQSPEFDGELSPKELTIASNHDESTQESSPSLLRLERSSNKKNKKKQQKLNIAVLRISYTVGYELLDLILHDSMNIQKAGGSKIILDSEEPSVDTTIILLWMLAAFSISASACCCLLLCINRGFILDEPAPQPQRPVRRRLTVDQVVEKYPLFHYHHRHEHGDGAGGDLLEECAICLDDLAEGIPCRQLPCQHVFHGRCIAKWLIERSATCPLCKIDLYEEEEEEEETESDSPGGDEDQVNFFHWMMETLLRSESGEGGEGNVEASPSTTAATNANPPANNLPSEETPPQPETPLTSSTWSSFNRWRRRLFRREVSAVNDLTEPLLQEGVSSQSPRRRDQDERETSGETHQDESLERPSQEQEVRDERNASPEELEASTGHDDHGPQEV